MYEVLRRPAAFGCVPAASLATAVCAAPCLRSCSLTTAPCPHVLRRHLLFQRRFCCPFAIVARVRRPRWADILAASPSTVAQARFGRQAELDQHGLLHNSPHLSSSCKCKSRCGPRGMLLILQPRSCSRLAVSRIAPLWIVLRSLQASRHAGVAQTLAAAATPRS